MIQHRIYQCPKCFNTLLISNKFLHDLRCTKENPATYENMLLRFSQPNQQDLSTSYTTNTNTNIDSYPTFSSRMSIKNDDGTMVDIVKEKTMNGKEESIEIKYDPQGNVISRKKAENFDYKQPNFSFHELDEYKEYEDYENNYDNNNNTYYEVRSEVRNGPSPFYETNQAQEIVYEAPAQFDPRVTINSPITYDPNITINAPIEETIISHDGNISNDELNNIIRHTMRSNPNGGNITIESNPFSNGYNYNQGYNESNNPLDLFLNNQNYLSNNQGNQIYEQYQTTDVNNYNNLYNNSYDNYNSQRPTNDYNSYNNSYYDVF